MLPKNSSAPKLILRDRAQAMVEFAIVLPILMLLLMGIFEVARMVFVYSAVTTASREAVRYGSAAGYDNDPAIKYTAKYKNCGGIRNMARRSAYFMNLQDSDIKITYDTGPDPITGVVPAPYHTCTPDANGVDPGYFIKPNARIVVEVSAEYSPYTNLVPWGPRTFTSSSARTILGFVKLDAAPGGGPPPPPPGGSTDTPTPTETGVPTDTPTETPTPTPAAPGEVSTFTPTGTATETPADLSTDTPTATATDTPTLTPTPTMVTGCENVIAGAISITGNTMTMTINNPNPYPLTIQDIYVVWNAAAGAKDGILTLETVSVGDLFQTIFDSSGNRVIVPSRTTTIPATALSNIIFTFDQAYVTPDDNESIVIQLSTLGCEGNPITSKP